jgi:hypothetical protein
MNFLPLFLSFFDSIPEPADPDAREIWLGSWSEVGGAFDGWSAREAAHWALEAPPLRGLLEPRSFDALTETRSVGPALLSPKAREDAWTPRGALPLNLRLRGRWDEAVELSSGELLAYPNDGEPAPNLSVYAPLAEDPALEAGEPIPVATVRIELSRELVDGSMQLLPGSDGQCSRWLARSERGERDLICLREACPNPCEQRVSLHPGGIRTARCAC